MRYKVTVLLYGPGKVIHETFDDFDTARRCFKMYKYASLEVGEIRGISLCEINLHVCEYGLVEQLDMVDRYEPIF